VCLGLLLYDELRLMDNEKPPTQVSQDQIDDLRRRLGPIDSRQVALWRKMGGVRRLELVGQAYHFVLETVRHTEAKRHPDLSEEALRWRVIRRMHGDRTLGQEHKARE
jgi:hypothetical protein